MAWLNSTASMVWWSLRTLQVNLAVLQRLSIPWRSFLMLGLSSEAQSTSASWPLRPPPPPGVAGAQWGFLGTFSIPKLLTEGAEEASPFEVVNP